MPPGQPRRDPPPVRPPVRRRTLSVRSPDSLSIRRTWTSARDRLQSGDVRPTDTNRFRFACDCPSSADCIITASATASCLSAVLPAAAAAASRCQRTCQNMSYAITRARLVVFASKLEQRWRCAISVQYRRNKHKPHLRCLGSE